MREEELFSVFSGLAMTKFKLFISHAPARRITNSWNGCVMDTLVNIYLFIIKQSIITLLGEQLQNDRFFFSKRVVCIYLSHFPFFVIVYSKH